MGKKLFNKANPATKQLEMYDDFSGGLNTELADSATKDNQFRELINFDMDKAGALVKRPGLYSIPLIKEMMQKKVDEIINSQTLNDDGQPVRVETLKIKDVVQFFDGQHWVFNYLTTWGTFALCLDKNMHFFEETQDITILNTYISFYPDSTDISKNRFYKTRITKYNDTFVMIKSQFAIDAVGTQFVKQNKLYN